MVGARSSGKSVRPVFFRSGKNFKFAKLERTALTNPTFFVFEIRISIDAMCCENVGRFHRRKLEEAISHKKAKTHFWGICVSRLKFNILTEMIVKHYLIVAYYL